MEYGAVGDLTRAILEIPGLIKDRQKVRNRCYRIIDEIYNPHRQLEVLIAATEGVPAGEGDDIQRMWRA